MYLHSSPDELEDAVTEPPEPPPPVFGVAVLFEAGLGLLALAAGWAVGFPPLATFSFAPGAVAWGVVATLPLLVGLVLMNRYPWGPLADVQRLVNDLIVPLFRDLRLWQLAVISLAAGVGEELLFRGLLQAGLATWLQRALEPGVAQLAALALASLLFGLMHPISKTYAALCVMVGFYLGALWMATGNLAAPIITHGLYDFAALVYLLRKAAVVK